MYPHARRSGLIPGGIPAINSNMENNKPAITLHELAPSQRPQERLEEFGAAVLSDHELLAMLLRSGSQKMDVLALATSIIREAGSLALLVRFWTGILDYALSPGIGER